MDELFDFDSPAPPPPAPVDPFSLLPVQVQLDQFKAVIAIMVSQAQALTVHDQTTAKDAVTLASKAKRKAKEIEVARKDIVAPHNDFVGAVNRLAKECTGPLSDIEYVLKKKINEHETRQRLELAKAQEAARLQAEINANAEAAGVPAPVVVTPVLPEAPAPIRTETGSASQRKEWTFEVINSQEIPREYLLIDERAIRDAVRRGIREIPGVKIFEHTKTVIRS